MNLRSWSICLWAGLGLLISSTAAAPALAKPNPAQTARQVDRLLATEVFRVSEVRNQVARTSVRSANGLKSALQVAPRVNDAAYLRRVWLDIVGDIPTPEHVVDFVLDPAKNKRQRVVRELLADPRYGQNWARYWRDVILYRRLEDRALVVANSLVAELTEKLNNNEPWNEIAAEFITATGDARENGMTAILIAQDGRTEETTAEMSRIFLGIQIQCCQCHDHPYDQWKREQFHELAGFFPRIAVRPVRTTPRSLAVFSDDRRAGPPRPIDTGRRGQAEHYMPDLDDPAEPGTRVQPKFFLTSATLPFGMRDAERRGTMADWMTENPWFATALVNRMWAELVGEGFYEPIDDIGPDRTPSASKAVEFLSRRFADSGYDVKWLFRVICATQAYQRESRPRRDADGTPFAANVAQPLRGDQLFNALLTALEIEETESAYARRGRPTPAAAAYGRNATVRQAFQLTFGYDPSDPRETVAGSIPQALAMMNSPRLNVAVRAIGRRTVLGRLLDEIPQDDLLVEELYLRTLSRTPTDDELDAAIEFCRATRNRSAVFEDLFWALLNSSEFSHRR